MFQTIASWIAAFMVGAFVAAVVGCGSAADVHHAEDERPGFPLPVTVTGVDTTTIQVTASGAMAIHVTPEGGGSSSSNQNGDSVNVSVDSSTTGIRIEVVSGPHVYRKHIANV